MMGKAQLISLLASFMYKYCHYLLVNSNIFYLLVKVKAAGIYFQIKSLKRDVFCPFG